MEKGTKLVLEQVVTTIASVADTSEEQFVAYYDRLMPCLKYIIENATTNELKLLRGKTIECVSLIGLAVGTEKVRTKLIRIKFYVSLELSVSAAHALAAIRLGNSNRQIWLLGPEAFPCLSYSADT